MNEDKAIQLINEWLELAKEVGGMNLNQWNMMKPDIITQWSA